MSDRRRNIFVLLTVVGLLAASIAIIFTKETKLGLDLQGGVQLVFQGKPTKQQPRSRPRASTARSTSCASASTRSASRSPSCSAPARTRST